MKLLEPTKNGMIFELGHLGRKTIETPTSTSGGAIMFSISHTFKKIEFVSDTEMSRGRRKGDRLSSAVLNIEP